MLSVTGEAEAGSAGSNASKDSRLDTHCDDREPVAVGRPGSNEGLLRVVEGFPDLAHDDEVDACSGALEMLNPEKGSWGIFDLYREQAEQLGVKTEPCQPAEPNWAPAPWNGKPSRTRRTDRANRPLLR